MKLSKSLFVVAVSMAIMLGYTAASFAGGEDVFKAKKCADCHATSGPSKIASIDDWEKKKGPDLWFAGSKYASAGWLEKWLAAPTAIRGVKWNSLAEGSDKHPAVSGGEAKEIAGYLMTLKDKGMAAGGANKGVNKIQGKILFEKKQACYACHLVKSGSKELGGLSGPSFVGAKDRLNPDWVAAYLKSPEKYDPKGRMSSFSHLSDGDISTLAGYVKFLD